MREDIANVAFPATPELGWARIMVHSQGSSYDGIGSAPVYSGAFSAHGTTYHVVTKDNYLRTKLAEDASPPGAVEEVDGNLVIWRDSDVHALPPSDGRPKAHTCAHDSMPYNIDPSENSFLSQSPQLQEPSWLDSWSGNSSLRARDDVAGTGDGMTTK